MITNVSRRSQQPDHDAIYAKASVCKRRRCGRSKSAVGIHREITKDSTSFGWLSLLLGILLLRLPFLLHAQEGAHDPPRYGTLFSYSDLQRLQSVGNVQMNPNGNAIAYSVHSVDEQHDSNDQNLWLVRLSGASLAPIALPHMSEPSWSPDGKLLAVVSNIGGKEVVQLLREDTLKVEHTFTVPSRPETLVWSPDGKYLAFTLDVTNGDTPSFLQLAVNTAEAGLQKPEGAQWAPLVQLTQSAHYREDGGTWLKSGHRHIFVLSTVDGALRQIGSEPFNDDDPAWLPDSKTLLFTSDRRPERERAYPVPAIYTTNLMGQVTRLTYGNGSFFAPQASPDGHRIAYIEIPYRQVNYTRSDLYVMQANGTQAHQLATDLDRDLSAPLWAPDGRGVYAKFDDHGVSHVGLFALDGRSSTLVSGLGGGFSISRNGAIAYPGRRADGPNELMLQSEGKAAKALTALNQFLRQRQLGTLMHLEARSGGDKSPVEGWALLPPGSTGKEKLPMILSMHGGPFGSDGPYWSTRFQLFAAAGYVVVYGNYRGSTSYGTAFSEPANHDFPGIAYDDEMSLVDEAISLGFVDPDRLFVTGGSAGGELTAWITGKTSRFRAAAAEKPVINQVSEALVSDQYLASPLVYGLPWTHETELWAHSSISLVGSVTTPILFIIGEQDFRTPMEETLQMYDALQLRGIPTALLRAPGAGHASLGTRPSQNAAIIAAILAWFHHYDSPRTAQSRVLEKEQEPTALPH